MTNWVPIAPWRLGPSQTLTLGTGAAAAFTNNVGSQTRAVMISATGVNVHIAVSQGGTVAATSAGTLVKTTDGPLVIACGPGDNVSCIGSGATVSLTELSH